MGGRKREKNPEKGNIRRGGLIDVSLLRGPFSVRSRVVMLKRCSALGGLRRDFL